jgi:hypothetical protein
VSLPDQYDLAIAWTWEFDREFVGIVEETAGQSGVSTYLIQQHNLAETLEKLRRGSLHIGLLLDRASDEDETFHALHRFLRRSPETTTRVLNPLDLQSRAADKATMHLEFLSHGIQVPYTIIISPYSHKRETEFSISELANLGRPFIIKPANTTGGGIGVVKGAETLKDVLEARQHHKNDKYLLQETVQPATLSGRRAWFRVIHAFGSLFSCWWDDQTHIYTGLPAEEEERFGLNELKSIAGRIHGVCKLDFFSTEIALTAAGRYVVVDYVNEICDMRLQSLHKDGVPDAIVRDVARAMVGLVKPA